MKEPLETRDVECPTCHAKAGAPCSKPVNSAGRPILGDHSARFKALMEARTVWEKWLRWHAGLPTAATGPVEIPGNTVRSRQ